MTHTILHYPTRELLWLSDLHLDHVSDDEKDLFLDRLRGTRYDAALITGDISVSKHLQRHLAEIARACANRPVYFLLGNHDYHGGVISEVDRAVLDLSRRHTNLVPLGQGEIVELSQSTALIGHRGWFDGRSGAGARTPVQSPDQKLVADFNNLSRRQFFTRLGELGEESAKYFLKVLPRALRRYKRVILATHVPPFHQAARYSGGPCHWNRQPFFTNRAAGNAIIGITRLFGGKVTTLAGHCHSAAEAAISTNLTIRVAGAQPGKPAFQEILLID